MKFEVRKTSLASPIAIELITKLNESLAAANQDPAAHSWTLNTQDVAPGLGAFVVVYDLETNRGIACGAIRKIALNDSETEHTSKVAELKRMFVLPEYRGQRVGSLIVGELERLAKLECSVERLVLETGPYLKEAIRLYEHCGFVKIPLFGEYIEKGEDFSVCFGKSI
ncbi:UNVERIFIED_CONTAM: hypothetical protein HDU68_000787 [Siphonaria sp. JEL0065]|nr:hypothetical protein HDU68_000787 [Siphonaria sp. JEL0065]